MRYRVIIQPTAWNEITARHSRNQKEASGKAKSSRPAQKLSVSSTEAYRWLYDRSPQAAARWRSGLLRAILSLETHPRRCPVAPESDSFNEEIRQLLYGRRRGVYRILFTIDDHTVSVLYVRHSARRPLSPD